MNRQFWNSLQEMPRKSAGADEQWSLIGRNLPKVRESPTGHGLAGFPNHAPIRVSVKGAILTRLRYIPSDRE